MKSKYKFFGGYSKVMYKLVHSKRQNDKICIKMIYVAYSRLIVFTGLYNLYNYYRSVVFFFHHQYRSANLMTWFCILKSAAEIGHLFTHFLYGELQILNAIGGDQKSQKVRQPQYYKQHWWVEVITLMPMCQHKLKTFQT